MDVAFLIILSATVGISVTSAVVTTWSLRARMYSLEDRVAILEGVTQREVKIRAASERWGKRSKDEDAVLAAMAAPPPQATPKNWWENPNLKKGAYVP